MGSSSKGAKSVNDALRGTRSERHEDKREKSERDFNNQKVREFIEALRKQRRDQT